MKSTVKKVAAFGILRPNGTLMASGAAYNASVARKNVCGFYSRSDDTRPVSERWKPLYKRGYRIVPIWLAVRKPKKVRR